MVLINIAMVISGKAKKKTRCKPQFSCVHLSEPILKLQVRVQMAKVVFQWFLLVLGKNAALIPKLVPEHPGPG